MYFIQINSDNTAILSETAASTANQGNEGSTGNTVQVLHLPENTFTLHPSQFQLIIDNSNTLSNAQNLCLKSIIPGPPIIKTSPLKKYLKATKSAISIEHPHHKIESDNGKYGPSKYVHIKDRPVEARALSVLPAALRYSHGKVIASRTLPPNYMFGPVQGVSTIITKEVAKDLISTAESSNMPVYLIKNDENNYTHIDVTDKDKSNWFSLIQLGNMNTANVWLTLKDKQIYAVTRKAVPYRSSIAVGYSKVYANNIGLSSTQPIIDLDENESQEQCYCDECECYIPTSFYQKHKAHINQSEDLLRNPKHKCRYCSKRFSRVFCLNRHIRSHCDKKKIIQENKLIHTINTIALNISPTSSSDFAKLPSDESLQNYTNGLDISTSIFDTDRISNLEMSSSSKSENDLFALSNKGENGLTAQDNKSNRILETCQRCDQTYVAEKKRSHIKKCTARRSRCDCGKAFTNEARLLNHIRTDHPAIQKNAPKACQPIDSEFKCEECKINFKRRGMLVNHMWKIHHKEDVTVAPAQRPQRRYPCIACRKIYAYASKRDAHVIRHHPGADLTKATYIETGQRTVAPSVCGACPRQYASRPKLIQHMRKMHPELAPPVLKKKTDRLGSMIAK